MADSLQTSPTTPIKTVAELARYTDYSLINTLTRDPDATLNGDDFMPRQVFSGHYVPVKPTPIDNPLYVAHSEELFRELGLSDDLAHTEAFKQLFSGDMSDLPTPMINHGWATGYALSIYGTEYIQQCPFQTGNGYGDGRAISVVEAELNGKRWEMQLKGAGRTPYCRGADGRAVLRSSVREFLAQEYMHALNVPTSRSLSLFVSQSDTVDRPWYLEGSDSVDPEIMVSNPVAITTRVAPSFLRVGQLELFARRARSKQHPDAEKELAAIVDHLIAREYCDDIDHALATDDKIVQLAKAFSDRLTSLVANWVRVGYCQGNFNSDNCAAGGFTLDYGPFGFCELFNPVYQPWTGGGRHFSFLNQPVAAHKNYETFCRSLQPLLSTDTAHMEELLKLADDFPDAMEQKMNAMWASKFGLTHFNADLIIEALQLLVKTSVDYTLFFRALSELPSDVTGIELSFYKPASNELTRQWNMWLTNWRQHIGSERDAEEVSRQMKLNNPKFTWREWLVVPAYQEAENGNFALIKELQQVLTHPYNEQTPELTQKYCQRRPDAFFARGGVSHYSCSS